MNDILINADASPQISKGDFDVGESDAQHVKLLLETSQGEWRESPLTGANLREWISQDGSATALRQTIRTQLDLDGATVKELKIKNGELTINAKYP